MQKALINAEKNIKSRQKTIQKEKAALSVQTKRLWLEYLVKMPEHYSGLNILSICSEANPAALHPFGKPGVTKHQT